MCLMAIRARLLTFDDLAGIQCLIAHKIYRLSLWLPMCVCGTCISAFGRYGFGQPCRMSPWLSPGWYEKWNVICLCLVALLLFSFFFLCIYSFILSEAKEKQSFLSKPIGDVLLLLYYVVGAYHIGTYRLRNIHIYIFHIRVIIQTW